MNWSGPDPTCTGCTDKEASTLLNMADLPAAAMLLGKNKVSVFRDKSVALHTGLARYFNKKVFSDLVIVAPDGRRLYCHQVVLSACSKRCALILEEGSLQGGELPVWGVDSDALETVLHFFYSGTCSLSYSAVVHILDAAQRLGVDNLAEACETFIHDVLDPSTCCSLFKCSSQYKMEELSLQCLNYIRKRFLEVVQGEDFLKLNINSLLAILRHVKNLHPDLIVFKAAWTWVISDVKHVQHLEEILKVVKVPDITFQELIKMGTTRIAGVAGPQVPVVGEAPVQTGVGASSATVSTGLDLSQALGGLKPPLGHQGPGDSMTQILRGTQGVPPGLAPQYLPHTVVNNGAIPVVISAPGSHPQLEVRPGGLVPAALCSSGPLPGPAALQGPSVVPDPEADQDPNKNKPPQSGTVRPVPFPSGALPLELLAKLQQVGYPYQVSQNPGAAFPAVNPLDNGDMNKLSWRVEPKVEDPGAGAMMPIAVAGWSEADAPSGGGGVALGGVALGDLQGSLRAEARREESEEGGLRVPSHRTQSQDTRGPLMTKGVCQVEGCCADLAGLRDYHLRYKICEHHLKVSSIIKEGVPQRFCQQCGRFHNLTEFDGNKRSCRARLQRHNARRRKRPDGTFDDVPPSQGFTGYSESQSPMGKRLKAEEEVVLPGLGASAFTTLHFKGALPYSGVPQMGELPVSPYSGDNVNGGALPFLRALAATHQGQGLVVNEGPHRTAPWGLQILADAAQGDVQVREEQEEQEDLGTSRLEAEMERLGEGLGAGDSPMAWGPKGRRSVSSRRQSLGGGTPSGEAGIASSPEGSGAPQEQVEEPSNVMQTQGTASSGVPGVGEAKEDQGGPRGVEELLGAVGPVDTAPPELGKTGSHVGAPPFMTSKVAEVIESPPPIMQQEEAGGSSVVGRVDHALDNMVSLNGDDVKGEAGVPLGGDSNKLDPGQADGQAAEGVMRGPGEVTEALALSDPDILHSYSPLSE